MKVRFDSLNRFEAPHFTICNPGSVYKDGLTSKTLGIFTDTSDEEIVFNFNTTSQLSFRAYAVEHEDIEESAYATKLFHSLQNRRLIFVDDIGYFIITNTEEVHEHDLVYKDITAQSCEIEIQNKGLTYIENGTYPFAELLEKIVSTLPKWTIGDIASGVREKYRTFEEIDYSKNTLAFMLEDMQNAYECIFVFDIMNRCINVYDQNDYVVRTNIHITNDSMIKQLQITENSDNIYTCINVLGDEDLGISAINPLGTNTIYRFDYYLDWMSDDLRDKVVSWQKLLENSFDPYYQLNLEYYKALSNRSELTAELEKLNIVLEMYKRCRDNIVAASDTDRVIDYNVVIAENGGQEITIQDEVDATVAEIDALINDLTNNYISTTEEEVAATDAQVNILLDEITAIHNNVAIDRYFTADEYDELYDFIFEGSYTDEYIAVTDIMSHSERFDQMRTLYDRAQAQLVRISEPTREFSVDSESFIFVKEFLPWSEQLETGCLINVELKPDDIAALFLSSMTVNYADKTLGFTFGNRFNRFDPKALFNDVLGGISKSTNSIDYIKDIIYPIKDGQLDMFAEALKNSRNLTMDAALSSNDQDVIIDATGYTGRKKLPDGNFDPRQIKIVNNSMVFTSNAWDSCHTAVGEIILDDGTVVYGINADSLIGRIIIGEQLNIINKDGDDIFKVVDGMITGKGYVTFSSLNNSGETTINGDNITTGTIKSKNGLSQINMNTGEANLTGRLRTIVQTYTDSDGVVHYAVSGVEPLRVYSIVSDDETVDDGYGAEMNCDEIFISRKDGLISLMPPSTSWKHDPGGLDICEYAIGEIRAYTMKEQLVSGEADPSAQTVITIDNYTDGGDTMKIFAQSGRRCITGLTRPVNPTDAVSKEYVDALFAQL